MTAKATRVFAINDPLSGVLGMFNDQGNQLSNFIGGAENLAYEPIREGETPTYVYTGEFLMAIRDGKTIPIRFRETESELTLNFELTIRRVLGAEARFNASGGLLLDAIRNWNHPDTLARHDRAIWSNADGLFDCGKRVAECGLRIVSHRKGSDGLEFTIEANLKGQRTQHIATAGELGLPGALWLRLLPGQVMDVPGAAIAMRKTYQREHPGVQL